MTQIAQSRPRPRHTRSERGAAAVEFAIVLTVLLLILFGIIDFGRLLFVTQAVKAASREGARVAAVRADFGPATTAGTVQKTAIDAAGAAVALGGASTTPGAITVGHTLPVLPDGALCSAGLAATNTPVQITVTVQFKWLTPVGLLPGLSNTSLQGTRPVSSSTTMRCE